MSAPRLGLMADDIARTFGKHCQYADWQLLRDLCDHQSGGELDAWQLDKLTDMVQARVRRAKANE